MSSLVARGWLVLCLAAILLASAFVAGAGHTHASTAGTQLAMHHEQAPSGHQHASPCADQEPGAADCCVSGPGCAVCAPLPATGYIATSHGSVFAPARPIVSTPGDDRLTLRPPELSVTA